jgi:hypothetical protein
MRKYNVSNESIIYDPRRGKQSKIAQLITSYNTDGSVMIIDYAIAEDGLIPIDSNSKNFSKAQIDGLFTQLQEDINSTESFTDKLFQLLDDALFLYNSIDASYPNYTGGWQQMTLTQINAL